MVSEDAENYGDAESRLKSIQEIEEEEFEEKLSETGLCSSQILAEAEDAIGKGSETKH